MDTESENEVNEVEKKLSKDIKTFYFPQQMPQQYKYEYVVIDEIYQHQISMFLIMNIEHVRPVNETTSFKPFKFELSMNNDWTSKDSHKEYVTVFEGEYAYTDEKAMIVHIKYERNGKPHWNSMQGSWTYPLKIYMCADSCDTIHGFQLKINKTFCKKYNENKTQTIYITTKHGDWIKYDRVYPRPLRSVYIDENVKTTLLTDMKDFIDNEKEYQRYGIPYKRNYLITGIPGSGKTSLIKAVCGEFDFDVCILTVEAEMTNHNLVYAMSHLPSKSVLVIEDIDCIFNKRSTTKDSASFNFSTLLNILDGTLSCSGLMVFVTTNHPQELDAAFVRQGRMDLILQINYPKKKEIKRLFYDMNENNPVYDTIEKKKDAFESFYEEIAGNDITMAAIVNFLFKNRGVDYRNNISDLLDTDKYIKEIMNETNLKEGRLYA